MKSTKLSFTRGLALFLCIVLLAAVLPTAALAGDYKDLYVIYNHQGIRADVGEKLTIKIKTDLPSNLASGTTSYQWYKAGGNIYGTGTTIPGETGSSYKVPTNTTGITFYYCVVTAKLTDGTTVSSESSEASMVWVNVQNIGAGFDAYDDGESGTSTVYSDQEIPLGFGQMNYENKTVTCQWYACDADGFPTGEVLSRESVFLAPGIPESRMMEPFYYKCVATAVGDKSGVETDEVLFCVMLYPVDVEPSIPFTDVPEGEWYYESIANAYWMELINGKTATTFCPTDNMTLAEALKLAACMHQLYTEGEVTLKNGDPWYQPYFEYCYANGIISEENNEENGYKACLLYANQKVTRSEYALWFSRALPNTGLPVINIIPDNSLPDVPTTNSVFNQAIYKLYRAGIVNGADAKGTFNPDSNIRRSEVAAILVRMMESSLRVGAPSDLGR